MQLQVQETLAAVAFKTPIKFNIQEVPESFMNAPEEDAEPERRQAVEGRRGDRKETLNSFTYIYICVYILPSSLSSPASSCASPAVRPSVRPPPASVLSTSS